MSFLINPFTFAVAGGDFESIATVTVGSGGASSIEFTSIPSTYQHLQVRLVARSTNSANDLDTNVRIGTGSIDTGSNYANHLLYGTGSTAAATGYTSASTMWLGMQPGATATASVFGATILDLLDYANTSKNTTLRGFSGFDRNGAGFALATSGLWINTAAVDQIRLYPSAGNFAQHSTAALYGVKAP
jgi:hypothetical protein